MRYKLTFFRCPACGGQVYLEPPDKDVPGRRWACMTCGVWGANFLGALVWIGPDGVVGEAICRTN